VLVRRPEDVQAYRQAWDELAVVTRRPYCSPAWVLSWWQHVRPPQAALRTVAVLDGTIWSGSRWSSPIWESAASCATA
jgi:hypothetical protein